MTRATPCSSWLRTVCVTSRCRSINIWTMLLDQTILELLSGLETASTYSEFLKLSKRPWVIFSCYQFVLQGIPSTSWSTNGATRLGQNLHLNLQSIITFIVVWWWQSVKEGVWWRELSSIIVFVVNLRDDACICGYRQVRPVCLD